MLFLGLCRAMLGARVQLKGWQQAAVAFGSAFGALLDPRRADLIAALGETTGKPAFERVLQRMKNSAEGRVNLYCPSFVRKLKFLTFGSSIFLGSLVLVIHMQNYPH